MKAAQLNVQVIAWTHFAAPADVPWTTDAEGGQALAEFAGRACYQSWTKPNPATATNAGYLAHIREVGHYSVIEHGTVTLYLTGVSRSFTHELIRHRHLSYSQLSQRYVTDEGLVVEPEVIASNPHLHEIFTNAVDTAQRAYEAIAAALEKKPQVEVPGHVRYEVDDRGTLIQACKVCLELWPCTPVRAARAAGRSTSRRKTARQAARAVLPNATETRIVVTGNYRAWRHFITIRATEHADVEIRQGAVEVLRAMMTVAPNVFNDFQIGRLPDGTEFAFTEYDDES